MTIPAKIGRLSSNLSLHTIKSRPSIVDLKRPLSEYVLAACVSLSIFQVDILLWQSISMAGSFVQSRNRSKNFPETVRLMLEILSSQISLLKSLVLFSAEASGEMRIT
jgi:hypothetical protein